MYGAILLEGEMKKDILWNADYRYDFDRDIYFNSKVKKAFSLEFVDDNSEEELRRRIGENTDGNQWQFYFNVPPPDGVKRELEGILG
jgi:hypothetical protein